MELTTESSSLNEPQTSEGKLISFYLYLILCSLGLIGNAFVCLVMLRYRKVFNSTTNKLIVHQSIIDFLASLLFVLSSCVDRTDVVPANFLGTLYCKLWWYEGLPWTVFFTSTNNLVAISLERYFATCHPVRYRNMFSSRRLKLIIAAIWLTSLIPGSHAIPVLSQIDGRCEIYWPSVEIQYIVLFTLLLTTFIIPMAILLFAYIKIILELHKRSRARDGEHINNARNMLSKAEQNVTKTLFVVAIFFVFCWVPVETAYLLASLGVREAWSAYRVVNAFVVVNLCVNPFIYCFTYERFQKQVRKMVCGGCQRNVNRVDTTSGSTRQEVNTQRAVQMSATVSVIGVTDNPA